MPEMKSLYIETVSKVPMHEPDHGGIEAMYEITASIVRATPKIRRFAFEPALCPCIDIDLDLSNLFGGRFPPLESLWLGSVKIPRDDFMSALHRLGPTLVNVSLDLVYLVGGTWVEVFDQLHEYCKLDNITLFSTLLEVEPGTIAAWKLWRFKSITGEIAPRRQHLRTQVQDYILRRSNKPVLLPDGIDGGEEQWRHVSDGSMRYMTLGELLSEHRSAAQANDT
jgi:hypothetical protein